MTQTPQDVRLLVVEDDPAIRSLLEMNFKSEGYHVKSTESGKEAIAWIKERRFDLVVLDVMLPDTDGFQVCESIRLQHNDVPVLFLTARNAGIDRIEGLRKGGDDYLTKPFELEELLLRCHNLLKRRPAEATGIPDQFVFGKCRVDWKSFEIIDKHGTPGRLNKREIQLLRYLVLHSGEVVRREDILQNVWGYNVFPSTRTIDNYILAFRKYFEEDPRQPRHFHSVRGVGYKFTP